MKTLICNKPYDLEYITQPVPTIEANEVLLKVKAVGICGTDIHAYTGRQPFFSYPRVFGHEICGEIVEIGAGCKKVKTGDKVAVIPAVSCQKCSACKNGKTNCCENISLYGVHQDGGFSEYLAVYENNVVVVPQEFSDISVAFIECFAIGAHAVRRAEIKKAENVLVVGAGPIGLVTAAIAKAEGAHVVIVDIDEKRCQHAENCLNVKTFTPKQADYSEQIKESFNGALADVIFDVTGNKSSMSGSVNHICHGGKIVFVGLYIGDLILDDPTFHKKETTLLSSRNATRQDFEKVISLYQAGALSEDILLSHKFSFDEVGFTYAKEIVENKDLIKAALEFKG